MNSRKRFLLIGHGGFCNRGCEAIVRGTLRIIREFFPDSEVTLQSGSPEDDNTYAREKRIMLDRVIPYDDDAAQRWSLTWFRQTLHRRIRYGSMSVGAYLSMPLYRDYDAVVSIGGDNFTDDYGSPKSFFDSLVAARKAGAKTVIWGASIGPFRDARKAMRWATLLRQVDLITVREPVTLEYLSSIGVSENVREVGDPAFLIPSTPPKSNPFAKEGKGLTVGFGISGLVARYGLTWQDYVAANLECIRYAVSSCGARILLVPHVFASAAKNNDLAACEEVAALLPKSYPVVIVPSSFNACEIKYCISQCDYFIGARTHSTIASLSMCIPTISIGYSTKATGINKAIFGTNEYVVPIEELSPARLIAAFDNLRSNELDIRGRLEVAVPVLCSAARRGGEYLHEILK